MKILLFSFLFEPELGGGAAVVVNQLAGALVAHSYDVVVVTTWEGKKIKTEYLDGIKLIRIPAYNLYWVVEKDQQPTLKKILWQLFDVWNPLIYRVVRQILLDEAPDIVHSHKLRGLSPSIWSAAKAAGVKKIVHTCHDYELLSPEGLFMGWAGRLAERQHFLMRPYQILRRYLSGMVDIVTAPSQFLLSYHERMRYFPNAEKKIIPNSHGFSLAYLVNQVPKKASKQFRLLYLGRLDKAKGVELLCEAFLRYVDEGGENGLLSIAGWGPLKKSLHEKYATQEKIHFLGAVSGGQKSALLRKNNFLVLPSVVKESFGLVLVEAFAHGTPVIASRIGAFPEVVVESKTGFWAQAGSIDSLKTAFERVSKLSSAILAEISANTLDEAKLYSIEENVSAYMALYEEAEQ